jgi:glutaminase
MAADGGMELKARKAALEQGYRSLARNSRECLRVGDLMGALRRAGFAEKDRRLKATWRRLREREPHDELDFDAFATLIAPENVTLISRILSGDLIIPGFEDFRSRIEALFEEVSANRQGQVATYIPQLARIDPDLFALAVCSIDGQQFTLGDDEETFCVQSVCKPITYAAALDQVGREEVHRHVGREPSGRGFNELIFNHRGLPHNPMINAGAMACSALIYPEKSLADRFDHVMTVWRQLCGGRKAGFDNAVFLSERETADRNRALAYLMRENDAFPPGTDILQVLDFYFQTCSITVDIKQLGVLAGTLANGGICPVTDQHVLSSEAVKDCLSLMLSCGMYDFSGEYAFTVGIPAKSGVSGALIMVVPGVCGFAVYSPRLDNHGNPVRGVHFSKRLVDVYAFHTYANMVDDHRLIDPRKPPIERTADDAAYLCLAGSRGDLGELRRLVASGLPPETADYDGRTALHLAASEGQLRAVEYLLGVCSDIAPEDRWGNTPLDDAKRANHEEITELLTSAYAGRGLLDEPA